MEKLSFIFKVIAKIIGTLCIAYGFGLVLIGGEEALLIIAGLFIIFLGLSYYYPNAKLQNDFNATIIYIVLTSLPVVILLILSFSTIITDGFRAYVRDGGLITAAISIPLSLFAPISSLLAYKHFSSNIAVQQTRKARR
jgi:hypothetical protein